MLRSSQWKGALQAGTELDIVIHGMVESRVLAPLLVHARRLCGSAIGVGWYLEEQNVPSTCLALPEIDLALPFDFGCPNN